MADLASHEESYNLWKTHNSRPRENTEQVVLGVLRDAYPDHIVTRTQPEKCNLLDYAAHGFATATPEDCPFFSAARVYKAPRSRLEKDADQLEDEVHFGRFAYEWNDTHFIVYQGRYEDFFSRTHQFLFVLHPRGGQGQTAMHLRHAATDALLMAAGRWTKELHGEILVFDDSEWVKSKDLWKSVQGASWDDVILDPNMKDSLIEGVQNFFDNRDAYNAMQVPWKRGVILHGVPGNGKTISIKALINSLAARKDSIPSLYVKSLDSCAGAKWSLSQIFQRARSMAPCLLIFEDLDSMVTPKTRSYFLNEVDGLESNEGILMIGSTNYLDLLDPSISQRPSRFDRKYHFKLPEEEQREAYCRYWCRKFSGSTSVDFPEGLCPLIAKMTPEFSFAYLKEMFVSSLLTLARDTYQGTKSMDENDALQDAEKSDNGSTSDGVVVERPSFAVEAEMESKDDIKLATDEKAAEEGKTAAHEKAAIASEKRKRVMPKVDIPGHLQGNALLRVITRQIPTLLSEMDNSDEAHAKKRAEAECEDDSECNPMAGIFQRAARMKASASS